MCDGKTKFKTAILAYFSGTGGTETIVAYFETLLTKAGVKVSRMNIPYCTTYHNEITSDLIIIFSPVYAFRLASIVERWTRNLPKAKDTLAAIISVSGGGEISPNTACRLRCKRLLIKKGYRLVYEKMLVMPSNFAVQAESQLNLRLINAMPKKAEQIVTEILSEQLHLTTPLPWDRIFTFIGLAEHFGAKVFGFSLHASKACTRCGLCGKKCPVKNIVFHNGVPDFGFHCIWCLKCIYCCPTNAIVPRILRFSVLKSGYNIEEMRKQMNSELDMQYKFTKSILWKGVIDYLK